MDTKFCPRCESRKPVDEFGHNNAQKDGRQSYCLPCLREYRRTDHVAATQKASRRAWYAKNAEQVLAKKKAEYHADIETRRAKARKANRDPEEYARHLARVTRLGKRIKAEVYAHYGTACACCGESNVGFLTIDHINGCGKETRKEHGLGGSFYRWLRRNGFPEGFQTLCYNCNLGRANNGGVCPHVAARRC